MQYQRRKNVKNCQMSLESGAEEHDEMLVQKSNLARPDAIMKSHANVDRVSLSINSLMLYSTDTAHDRGTGKLDFRQGNDGMLMDDKHPEHVLNNTDLWCRLSTSSHGSTIPLALYGARYDMPSSIFRQCSDSPSGAEAMLDACVDTILNSASVPPPHRSMNWDHLLFEAIDDVLGFRIRGME
jgi:hypothetical protein